MKQGTEIGKSETGTIRGCLIFFVAILLMAASVGIPLIPLKIFSIKFSILNYIYSAGCCTGLMILFIVVETIILKQKDNENSK
jgi:hypothetical protein